MGKISVSLFGKFCVKSGEAELRGFDLLKVQELFCYLLLYRSRPHPRETLASLLWGDNPTSQARRYLSKALWQLQSALSHAQSHGNLLLVDPDWVWLDTKTDLQLDVEMFEQAYDLVKEIPGEALDHARFQALQDVIESYHGELLEGWYQDWCLCERERLQFLYLTLLDKLIRFCEAHGEYETGRILGYKILSYDRARERTHRQLMRLHYLAGDRTGALRQYRHCRQILKEELDVLPSKRTDQLYEKICADEPIQPLSRVQSNHLREAHPIDQNIWQLVEKMKHLRGELEKVERDLRSSAKLVDRTTVDIGFEGT